MRAVVAGQPGGPEVLGVVEVPDPRPEPGELLLAVRATAVNRADVLQRQGDYPPPPGVTDVLGLEAAGEVTAVGPEVDGWEAGDRACVLLAGGGYAERVAVPAALALPVPDTMSDTEAAAVPEAFLTAFDNLFLRGQLRFGETVLLHGGGSGVGTAATQLASWRGCRVLVTASSGEKLEACARLGADAGINYAEEDFSEAVRGLTDGRGVDVVLDIVGGPYLDRNLKSLATEGRLVVIGLMGGATAMLNLGLVLPRRLTIAGSVLRSRSVAEKAELVDRFRREVWPAFADGTLHAVVDRVLPLAEVAEAHRVMEASEHFGKIVLTVP